MGGVFGVLGPLRRNLNRTFDVLEGRPPSFRGECCRRLKAVFCFEVCELFVARDLKRRQVRVLHLECRPFFADVEQRA